MDDISLLYESVLINEISDQVISYLDTHREALPFPHIFGDKLRLIVPIGGDLTAKEILEDLKSLKDYSGIDVGSGEVIRKIKLDPKYGQGSEKEQKINIGRAVNALKIDPDKKKKYLDWLAKYKDNLSAALSDISEPPLMKLKKESNNNKVNIIPLFDRLYKKFPNITIKHLLFYIRKREVTSEELVKLKDSIPTLKFYL